MKVHRVSPLAALSFLFVLNCSVSGSDPENQALDGAAAITAEELKLHLDFLAADEMRGRDTPSNELKIAARYLSVFSQSYGLKPVMPEGSFFQKFPLETNTISVEGTGASLNGSRRFSFPTDFGFKGGDLYSQSLSGEIVFLGFGLEAPEASWNDLDQIDVQGKIAVILDADLPTDSELREKVDRRKLRNRDGLLRSKGAAAVLAVISHAREEQFRESGRSFDNPIRARYLGTEDDSPPQGNNVSVLPTLELRHAMASRLLGVTQAELSTMLERVRSGEQVGARAIPGTSLAISVETQTAEASTRNVVAVLEGSDPDLRDEYVLFGAHYDHLGVRDGEVYNGASDNASGSAALLVLAKAMAADPPRRSLVFAWFSGEEKAYWGSREFIENPPIPLENISACINLDVMVGKDLSKVTTIAGRKLSSELDEILQSVNEKQLDIDLDRKFDETTSSLFFSSDHYSFMRNGIPSVWLSSEAEPSSDIHRPTDTPDKSNGKKIALITKLAFYTALEIANRDEMLKLDLNPEITTRGSHNLGYDWRAQR